MIEIIPNWHPVFVHFTIGLLLTAAGLFAASALLPQPAAALQAGVAARWNLWTGTAFAIATVVAGYRAYYTVAHDEAAHAAMLVHMKWAWAALVLFALAAGLAWRERHRARGAGPALAVLLAAGAGALLVTGYLGGENVFRHGLGVMRLPAADGPGHGHAHEAGHAHEHPADAAAEAPPGPMQLPESVRAAAAVVDAFHQALAAGDLDAAGRLLDPGLLVFEGGGTERSAQEYASHHMRSDAEFLHGASVELLSRSGGAGVGHAWVASESSIRSAGGAIASKETMVLRNTPAGWRIRHIHWSSRPLQGGHQD